MFCKFSPTTGKIIKSHSFHQQRQHEIGADLHDKKEAAVYARPSYVSTGLFHRVFPFWHLKLPLWLKISSVIPWALCYSPPSSSCSHRKRHSTTRRKWARGWREHRALNPLSTRDQKWNGRALKAGSGLNCWPSLKLQTSLRLIYPPET